MSFILEKCVPKYFCSDRRIALFDINTTCKSLMAQVKVYTLVMARVYIQAMDVGTFDFTLKAPGYLVQFSLISLIQRSATETL